MNSYEIRKAHESETARKNGMNYREKYIGEHYESVTIRLNKATDADVLEDLKKERNQTGYIRDAIRYFNKHKN